MRDKLIALLHETVCGNLRHGSEDPICMVMADRLVDRMKGLVLIPREQWDGLLQLLGNHSAYEYLIAEHLP